MHRCSPVTGIAHFVARDAPSRSPTTSAYPTKRSWLARCAGSSAARQGDLGGTEDLRAAVEEAPQSRYWAETAHAYINLADWIWFTEGPRPALRTYQAGIDFAERRGLVDSATWAKAESLWTLFETGAWCRRHDRSSHGSDGTAAVRNPASACRGSVASAEGP
jgi:hypothetical protein